MQKHPTIRLIFPLWSPYSLLAGTSIGRSSGRNIFKPKGYDCKTLASFVTRQQQQQQQQQRATKD